MKFSNYLIEQKMNSLFESILINLKEEKIKREFVEIDRIDESVSITLIISVILALPSLLKTISKVFGFFYKKMKKLFGGKEMSRTEELIVKLADKWHHHYIMILRQILKVAGVFKSAGIDEEDKQIKATEVVFYTIIFGFAVHGGIATAKGIWSVVNNISQNGLNLTILEAVLTAIKSKEIRTFIKKIG